MTVAATLLVACGGPPAATGPSPSATTAPSTAATQAPSQLPATAAPTPSPSPEPLAWRDLRVAGPVPREDHTWTISGDGATAYLFGGRDGATVHGDLWAFDVTTDTWTPLETGAGPAPRFGHEAAWVDGIGLVIFAGQAGTTFFNDLWAFDPDAASWHPLPSGGDVPVARYGTCAAIGPDGRLWISHGFTADGTRFADTRAYDFASGTWADETPEGDLPVNRCLHGCWWTADGELALFAGQTTGVTALDDRWLLGADGWIPVEGDGPSARNLYARARIGSSTIIFGGQALDGSRLDDVWLLPDSGRAEEVVVGGGPPGRSGSELVVDAERGRVLLFGGLGTGGVLGDTWELTGDLPAAGGRLARSVLSLEAW